ncbi:acyltransferase family protein [Rhodococcus erythropolis]|uniref:acyltransferase family protein n=1 Tax=Rhodococcus erythropolis TaxID=1833 RepID=UPI0015C49A62|nr:acyltransferase [Rhodococcus erythropolis]MCZ4567120.1 acyltransferase [Rhodococcus erythropolis]
MPAPVFLPESPEAAAPRVNLPGADLLRTLAVAAVIYSHISFYVIDDLGSGWWVIDVVYGVLIEPAELNQHLSFVGVAVFMMLTGALVTRSAIRDGPGKFLTNRFSRLLPAFWVATAIAILLVRLGINGMFSGQEGISDTEALMSFFLGGFFLKPEVAVLGVTWTLTVQFLFYLACVAARPILRLRPIVMPLAGGALCSLVLLYNVYAPLPYTVPMLSKIAATLPAVFLGQIMYLAWAKLAPGRWLIVAVLVQMHVIIVATQFRVYWAGEHYLWTISVVAAAVVLIGRYDGVPTRWSVVKWLSTRSYIIYLVHTLILYRVVENTVLYVGPTLAFALFLLATAAVAEIGYRWVELPGARAVTAWRNSRSRVASKHELVRRHSGTSVRKIHADRA